MYLMACLQRCRRLAFCHLEYKLVSDGSGRLLEWHSVLLVNNWLLRGGGGFCGTWSRFFRSSGLAPRSSLGGWFHQIRLSDI